MWNWIVRRRTSAEAEVLQQLNEQTRLLQVQGRELGEQLVKLSRLQYKSGNDIQLKLGQLNESIGSLINWQETYDSDNQAQTTRTDMKLEQAVQTLIRWLDDLDLVRSRLTGEEQTAWTRLLNQWTEQILDLLETLDIRELQVLGSSFDPRLAESIGTMSKTEVEARFTKPAAGQGDVPYQIVEVTKRGFIREDGRLLRKAQVITIEGENHNG